MATLVSSEIQSLIDLICDYHPNEVNELKIKGLVFDFGSVLSHSTKKFVKTLMETALSQSIQTTFNLTHDQTTQFMIEFKQLKSVFVQRKLFLGTCTCLDEGFLFEYTLNEIVRDALINIGIDPNSITAPIENDLCASYRQPCLENAQMIDGVSHFLQWCKDNSIRCAICSNYFDAQRTKQMLVAFGIARYFDIIQISGEVGFRKPDYRIIKPIFAKWNDLHPAQIVFIGDNSRRDTLLAHYCNIRSILARFTYRKALREKDLPSQEKADEKLKSDFQSFVNYTGKNIAIQCVSEEIGYTKSEAIVTDYNQIPAVLLKIARLPYIYCRPLLVGLFILPQKIEKLVKRNVFHMKHRRDIICKPIDFNTSLPEQGPFDIFIHKMTSWYVAAKYDLQARQQLHSCLEFINQCKTNINHTLKGYDGKDLQNIELKTDNNTNENVMFVTDDPENAKRTCDRMDMYDRIINANIEINNVIFTAPKFILVENENINLLKNKFDWISSKLSFPIIAKPRLAASPVVNGMKDVKACAHTMYIIPDAAMIYDAISCFEFKNTDWILQEYINHNGCHKVYVIGSDVFVTVNDSTPNNAGIRDTFITIDGGKFSKKPLKDQSGKQVPNVYTQLSLILSAVFGLNCYGYDLLFDSQTNNGYIVDCNYLPGYKSVTNFSAVFWGFVLKQYKQFMKSLN